MKSISKPYKDLSPFPTVIKDGWQILGPGGGGSMFVPTVSPHDPDIFLVACDMTGTYITQDGGRSWTEINLKTRVDAMTFDPVRKGVIYAGSSGLFRSEDNGRTWKLIFPDQNKVTGERFIGDEAIHKFISADNWPGGRIQAIRVDPLNPDRIFIGIGIGLNIGYDADRLLLFYSEDYGRNWTELCQVEGSIIRRMYTDPCAREGESRLYVFTNTAAYRINYQSKEKMKLQLPDRVGTIISAACGVDKEKYRSVFFLLTEVKYQGTKLMPGVMRSLDNGETWAEMTSGLDDDFHGPLNGQERWFRHIAVCENDARTAYVAVWRRPEIFKEPKPEMNYEGVMKTEDMGTTWKWVQKIGADFPPNMETGWLEERYDTDWMGAPLFFDVCPSNPDYCIYTSMGTTYKTVDGGKTWNQLYCYKYPDGSYTGRSIEVTTCYGVHFDPFDKEHIAVSYTDIGGAHSTNGGRSWKSMIDGVPVEWINTCYWLVFDPEVKGRAWSVWANAHDLPREKMFRTDRIISHKHYKGGVCRSENGLKSWIKSSDGIPENSVPTHIVLDPGSPVGNRTLYTAVCGRGVYKSTDDGYTWTLKNNGIKGSLCAWRLVLLPDGTLYLLVMRSLKDGKTVPGAIYKSCDGAESWQEVAMPPGTNAPNDLVFDPSNPKRLYLSCWPETINDEEKGGGAYVTEDGGVTWKNIFNPSSHVYAMEVDPDNPSVVFLTNFENTLYRSDDYGNSWKPVKGYDFKWGHRPVLDPYNKGMLYVTTFGSSIWYGPGYPAPSL